MTSKTIYVVEGSTGEYSDHQEWLVCAFWEELDAQGFIEQVSDRAREIFQLRHVPGWRRYPIDSRFANDFDPGMAMDYTGTNYNYYPVELRGQK